MYHLARPVTLTAPVDLAAGARPRAEAALGALRGRVKWAAARLMQGRSMPDLAFCFDENDEVAARAEAEAEEAQV